MEDPQRSLPLDPKEALDWLRFSVTGIDIHPVAVHLARSAWVLAAQPAIQAAVEEGFAANITVPIYLGDSLQLRFHTGDLFAEQEVTIQVGDEENTALAFPVSLVERAEDFDGLMSDVAEAIEHGDDPYFALDDHGVTFPAERKVIGETIEVMKRLHAAGRDHIWAYYTRNLVRPVVLARKKVDVIVGNPPWLNYNKTSSILRSELEGQSKNRYGIWQGGRYATHQDVAGLFYARCVDLYLKDGGVIGMVMPHSALQTGQYAKWRMGNWQLPTQRQGSPSRLRLHSVSGLQPQASLGPGEVGTQHLLPHRLLRRLCQEHGQKRPGNPPVRRGGTLDRCAGGEGRKGDPHHHNRHIRCWRFRLRPM